MEFETKGINILDVLREARANGNEEFAILVEKQFKNVQTCYDVIAQKISATGEEPWRIDAKYLEGLLK